MPTQNQLRNATILCACLFLAGTIVLAASFQGCSAMNPAIPAKVNQTISTIIADAGTVAITAKAQYDAGKIPQTEAARYAINDLGNAYEQAKKVYLQLLQAQGTYNGSQFAQMNSCAPDAGPAGGTCQAATLAVTTAKTNLDNAQAQLSASLNTLVSKTNTVKALQPKN